MSAPIEVIRQAAAVRAANKSLIDLSVLQIEDRLGNYEPSCVMSDLIVIPELKPLAKAERDTKWSIHSSQGSKTLVLSGTISVKRIATEVFEWLHQDMDNLILPRAYEIEEVSLRSLINDLGIIAEPVPRMLAECRVVLLDREYSWAAQEFLGEIPLVIVELDRLAELGVVRASK